MFVFLTVLSEVLWPIISGVFSPNPNNLFSWFAPKAAATVTTLFSQTFNWQQQHRGVRCSPLPPRWFPWFTLCLCLPSPYPHPPMSQGQRLEFSNFNIEVRWSIVNIHNMRRRHLAYSLFSMDPKPPVNQHPCVPISSGENKKKLHIV